MNASSRTQELPLASAAASPAHWLPHGAAMVLIDRIERWDGESLCATSARHCGMEHPLAAADGTVAAVHLLEYAAQAAAIHIGRLAAGGASGATATAVADGAPVPAPGLVKPGVIAFVRELDFDVAAIAPAAPTLWVEVRRRAAIPGGMAYGFRIAFAADGVGERVPGDAPMALDDASVIARGVFGVVLGAGPGEVRA